MAEDTKQQQMELIEKLKLKVLQHLDRRLDEGVISGTEVATLISLLKDNGWVLDESQLPGSLKDKVGGLGLPTMDDEADPEEVWQA